MLLQANGVVAASALRVGRSKSEADATTVIPRLMLVKSFVRSMGMSPSVGERRTRRGRNDGRPQKVGLTHNASTSGRVLWRGLSVRHECEPSGQRCYAAR